MMKKNFLWSQGVCVCVCSDHPFSKYSGDINLQSAARIQNEDEEKESKKSSGLSVVPPQQYHSAAVLVADFHLARWT